MIKNNFNSKQWWNETTKTSVTYWGDEPPYEFNWCMIGKNNLSSGTLVAVPGVGFDVTLDENEISINTAKYKISLDNKKEHENESVVEFMSNGGDQMLVIEYKGQQKGLGGDVTISGDITRHTFTESGVYTP